MVFVIRKANTPRCGPLHCVHSISNEGVLKLQSVMALMLLVMTESLRPWDGALRGALLFGLSGRRGEPLFS